MALCLFIEAARGSACPPRCWPGSWVEQVFVYTVWGTTVVLLIPALAGVPAAPGRWQPSGAGRERSRHCCVSQPRSMPLCLLLHMFTPPREPGHGGASGAECPGWGTTPGLQGCPQTSIVLDPPSLASHRGGGTRHRSGCQIGLGTVAKVHRTCLGASTGQGRLAAPHLPQLSSLLLHPNASHVHPCGLGNVARAVGGPAAGWAAGCPATSPLPLPQASVPWGCQVQPLLLPVTKLGFHLPSSKCGFLSPLCAQTLALSV